MDTQAAPPLSLSTVLEEEFLALHGALPPSYPSAAADPERLPAIFDAIHRLSPRRTALCLSGGGIRSATFSLGVLQTLARLGLLPRFDYLSTVSGGGYIGGWLSAWIQRTNLATVVQALATGAAPGPAPEPDPVRWLRAFSNYLSPKTGLLSIDTWALGVIFVRNLLINWVLLLPLLAALVVVPQLCLLLVQLAPDPTRAALASGIGTGLALTGIAYATRDLPGSLRRGWSEQRFRWGCLGPLAAACGLLALAWRWRGGTAGGEIVLWHMAAGGALLHTTAAALSRRGRTRRLAQSTLAWLAVPVSGAVGGTLVWLGATRVFAQVSDPRWYLLLAPPWLVLSLLAAVTAYIALASTMAPEEDREWWARAGAWLVVACVTWVTLVGIAVFAAEFYRGASGAVATFWASAGGLVGLATAILGKRSSTGLGELAQVRSLLERYGLNLGAGLFVLTLLVLLAAGTDALIAQGLSPGQLARASGLAGVATWPVWAPPALLLALLTAGAFLLSWVIGINRFSLHSMYGNRLIRAYLGASHSTRNAHPLTGFDPDDNLDMHGLAEGRPLHVVNMALNLVRGDNLAWQQRKAKSFTVSRLHCGAWNGPNHVQRRYRPANGYGGADGISLGKAITISGAAASPNMGYHSSPLVGFVMTFFNARLGWWLGNPGCDATWQRSEPALALRPLIDEALGLTTDDNPYVYLSDGGHFENLGLYEMVLRRCHAIVAVDAGCDPQYQLEDLSGAIRKIRTDLGIAITLQSRPSPAQPWAVGTIRYADVDPGAPDGLLIVLKPVLTADVPLDVQAYAATHADPKNPFPQQTTADQFFDEAQFESYRALGAHVAELARAVLLSAVSSQAPAQRPAA
ncbi:MAG: patatin-like phospholipase family protein [Candidatus Binatia bacterium]